MRIKRQIEQMARHAKKAGWTRKKAEKTAPSKEPLRSVFLDEFDRYHPRSTA